MKEGKKYLYRLLKTQVTQLIHQHKAIRNCTKLSKNLDDNWGGADASSSALLSLSEWRCVSIKV